MELANGTVNKFFSVKGENKYWSNDFDIHETQGMNNVLLLVNEVERGSLVLDVGCAYGKIGQELIKKDCSVYGVDMDKVAAEMAITKNGYKDVFLFNVEDYSSEEYARMEKTIGNIDTIVFSDVFEHLNDPTNVLMHYVKFLKDNGQILVSVPNVAHMDIILHLMDGEFNYSDMGILDNTHMKFFTKQSFAQWIDLINKTFADVKLDCEYLGATFYNNEYMKEIETKYPKLFHVLSQNPNYNGMQILFKLNKVNTQEMAVKLQQLLGNKDIKVSALLGDIIEDKQINIELSSNINKGEKSWFQQRITELEKGITWHRNNEVENKTYVESLEKAIEEQKQGLEWYQTQEKERSEWYQTQEKESQIYVKGLEKHIEEQKQGLDWYESQEKERKTYIDGLEKHIEQQQEYLTSVEDSLGIEKIKQNELQAKIFEMENSFSWKTTKILRKKR